MILRVTIVRYFMLFALLLAGSAHASAATVTFTGGGDGVNWEDPDNWDTGLVPTAADDVIITNANSVSISTEVAANSLRINMTAQLTVTATGVLNLDQVTANGNMLQLNDNAILTNDGEIMANQAASNAIDLNDDSRVINNGTMHLTDPSLDPINLTNTAEFTNHGTIYGSDGSDAIEMSNSTKFYNYGDIYMEGFSDEGIEVNSSTTFVNHGLLSITDAVNDLICIDGSGDHFMNAGMIELNDPGNTFIEIDNGLFTNQEGGSIKMNGGSDNGIQLESGGDFDNYGEIDIHIAATSSADDGIEIQSSATFRNFNRIDITLTGDANANAIFLDASSSRFLNDACGLVNMLSNHRTELDGGAILTNNGVLYAVYDGTHDNQGSFINNGLIDAPNGFTISPNAVTGSPGTAQDGEFPTAECSDLTLQLDADGDASTTAEEIDNGSTDNCYINSLALSQETFGCADVGGNTVTLTVTDNAGNESSCTATVTVEDNIPPTISCPGAISPAVLDANCENTLINYQLSVIADDNCEVTLSQSPIPGTVITGAQTVTVTVTVSDGTNEASCTYEVPHVDITPPTLDCSNLTEEIGTDEGECFATVEAAANGLLPGYSDNCEVVLLEARYRLNNLDEDPGPWSLWTELDLEEPEYPLGELAPGRYQIRWRITDPGGLTDQCTRAFEVVDDEAPTVTCQPVTIDFNGEAEINLTPAEFIAEANDNCGIVLSYTDPAGVSCEQLGEVITVTVTVEDEAGNPGTCEADLTIDGLPCGWMTFDDHVDCESSSADYEVSSETFYLTSADCSHSPYSPFDEEYAYVKTVICGDGEIIAQVDELDGLGKAWAGITMRESNDPDSKKFQVMTGLDYLQHRVDWRSGTGGLNQTQAFSRYGQHWLRIVRTGPIFQAFTSFNGMFWGQPVNTQVIPMDECLEVGLIVTNVPYASNVTASFNHVQVTPPYSLMEVRPDSPGVVMADDSPLPVYPNPTNGRLTVDLSAFQDQEATLEVLDLDGQLILQRPLGVIENQTEQLDLSEQAAGMYFIRVRTAEKISEVQRVILQPRP
ncbi:MAG: T9SS type A sorting domain-containing protein [Lewinella sp.]|nr:T9SS type A sorting domain-containing protein [Lewinella sp.]